MEHKRRKVEYNCKPGVQFQYVCDECGLELYGHDNKNFVQSANGCTWRLTRAEKEIATAGNKLVQKYGGTEEAALEEGLKRFDEERCDRPN
jgi:hypothetical protein